MTQVPPPGWYPDGRGNVRYWDGNQWTAHVAPSGGMPAGQQPQYAQYPQQPRWAAYPVQLSIAYPERPLNRWSTAFRIILVIPIFVLLALLPGGFTEFHSDIGSAAAVGGGVVFLPTVFMILFRKKYPRWWFDWNLELQRFSTRVMAYLLLMDDRYPSTDEQQSVRLNYEYPDASSDLMRGMPLVKWLLAIPHFIVLVFLGIGAFFAVIAAWFAILFTGRYPRGIFRYVEGVLRWGQRINGYAFVLVTDMYPPFRLSP